MLVGGDAPLEVSLEGAPAVVGALDGLQVADERFLFVVIDLDKRLGALLLGGVAAVSLAGKWLRSRAYRAAVAKELKKQLAPLNKKLDELEKQNEELKKQNEQLRKQLK